VIGGFVGFAGHITIGDDVKITGYTMVSHSLPKAGMYSSGIPVEEVHTWRRLVAWFKRIDSLATRIKKLEDARGRPHDQEEDDD
jgi:UDP-3-O-[3-hydroxymyristoyl] glucosamine N-acyltransferase